MEELDSSYQFSDQYLKNALKTSLFDSSYADSLQNYQIHLLTNDPRKNLKVLTTIEDELQNCSYFEISVAFITLAGIEALKSTLEILQKRNIKGRLLTTNYLTFSEPVALRFLSSLKNIEVRMFCCKANEGFHTKGYLFSSGDLCHIIIGSSNLTVNALTTNKEWNLRFVSKQQGAVVEHIRAEFAELWEKAQPISQVLPAYEQQYKQLSKAKAHIRRDALSFEETKVELKPNEMQDKFVKSCLQLIAQGQKRGLLISATGTGKTYAAAFATREIKPAKLLFIVHREQIASKALESFKRVLGSKNYTYGMFTGNEHQATATCVFSTVQTIAKEANLKLFTKDHFDLIIIDEVHHAGATSYQRILNYFDPKFCLGMTASPERSDGYNLFELFNYNIAYEIRLQSAMEQDLLCPFHYFGITDVVIEQDGEEYVEPINSKSQKKTPSVLKGYKALASDVRVNTILEKAKFYGYSGNRVKGLVFCSTIKECQALSKKFNDRGYKSVFLSGENTPAQREDAIARLQSDSQDGHELDYIFSVDVFNEGIDIPEINQIIMLRPTQSAIVFLQQLGRGLRKSTDKQFLVVLDFIGNYQNNYLIPVALSGDNSYNKDNMRRFTSSGVYFIPGASSIHFDEIATKRIFEAIDKVKTNSKDLIRNSYRNLKYRLGHIPKLMDFVRNNEIDPLKLFSIKDYGSYYSFLKLEEAQYQERMSALAEHILNFLCHWLGRGQRLTEVLLLEDAIQGRKHLLQHTKQRLEQEYDYKVCENGFDSAISLLCGNFFATTKQQEKKADCVCLIFNDSTQDYELSDFLKKALEDGEFVLRLGELFEFIKHRFAKNYRANRIDNTDLCLNQKYSYQDVCRLLNWKKEYNAQTIGGYIYHKDTKTLPVFINYNKDEKAISYEDRFIDENTLIALSKRNKTVDSEDAARFFKRTAQYKDNNIYLFVRRNKDDKEGAKFFYFLGEIEAVGQPIPTKVKNDDGLKTQNAFEIQYRLKKSVDPEIYKFLTGTF